ncbi:tumor necrosis factor receptor superfamily member 1A [Salarias fasciatus]|uniref:tumor necrosis factor receptor superfamily member 1A n=1 Tax=Salarias fasciatus TaxID=181472 RepID=UPI00117683D7|nr:tumor necrosis factor receptor superfamily member 1A [Salarias fasciatus]
MMEGAWLRRRSPEKAHVAILLLFMCELITAHELTQRPPTPKCEPEEYLNEERGVCCNKCPPGFKLVEMCLIENHRSTCAKCPKGQYRDSINYASTCRICRQCKDEKNEFQKKACKTDQNTICQCKPGFYRFNINSETYECRRCSQCKPDEWERHTCTPTNNTVCGCKENYHRVNNQCEPCTTCTAECNLHCISPPSKTQGPGPSNTFFINVIAGIGAVVLVMFAAVVLVTHKLTKRFTQREPSHPVLQQSEDSPESCKQILIVSEEPSQTDTAVPHSLTSEQEGSNLPDCVPLEIKISDLIYTVLDLVSALQVKQLVRSLGVNDTEIEQAELDYRSCREAHYQMLRVWAERGSRAGGGGHGGMLHRPLLEELLDKLRKMHLGNAAEQLETKYEIQ